MLRRDPKSIAVSEGGRETCGRLAHGTLSVYRKLIVFAGQGVVEWVSLARFFDIGKEGKRRAESQKEHGREPASRRRYEGQAARVTMKRRGERNMPFCETNRIGFSVKTGGNILRWSWMRRKGVEISIRFV